MRINFLSATAGALLVSGIVSLNGGNPGVGLVLAGIFSFIGSLQAGRN